MIQKWYLIVFILLCCRRYPIAAQRVEDQVAGLITSSCGVVRRLNQVSKNLYFGFLLVLSCGVSFVPFSLLSTSLWFFVNYNSILILSVFLGCDSKSGDS